MPLLHGVAPVMAALRAKRRAIDRLFVAATFTGDSKKKKQTASTRSSVNQRLHPLLDLAEQQGVDVVYVSRAKLSFLMTQPHKLKTGHVRGANPSTSNNTGDPSAEPQDNDGDEVICDTQTVHMQSPHQGVVLQCSDRRLTRPLTSLFERPSLVVCLDGVSDPMNLGAIARSAFFFGADCLVLGPRCAPVCGAASKASAGALEYMDLYKTDSLASFLSKSQQLHNVQVYAADAPDPAMPRGASHKMSGCDKTSEQPLRRSLPAVSLDDVMCDWQTPVALVLGSEGSGVAGSVLRVCRSRVFIPSSGVEDRLQAVDSLNVSAAAAVLLARFASLRRPLPVNHSR